MKQILTVLTLSGFLSFGSGVSAQDAPDDAVTTEPAAASGGSHSDLAKQATNPGAPLIQLQLQNLFIPSTHGLDGYANQFIVQPVIPFSKQDWMPDFLPRSILRPTIPIVTSADIDGGPDGTTGLGDTSFVYVFANDLDWGILGLGPAGLIPTSTDLRLGSRHWGLGPAIFGMYTKIPNVQVGALVSNTFGVGGSGPGDLNSMSIQLIANYHWGDGYYAGWGDQPLAFNWENDGFYVPLSARIGKVGHIGNQPVNIFIQGHKNVGDQLTGQSEWGIKLNVTLLFPE